MRPFAQPFPHMAALAMCTALAWPWPAQAQPAAQAPSPLDTTAPHLPLQHMPLAASGPVEQGNTPWREANTAVSAFPQGHADVLRWEAAQTQRAQPTQPMRDGMHAPANVPASAPSAGHTHHHGGRP